MLSGFQVAEHHLTQGRSASVHPHERPSPPTSSRSLTARTSLGVAPKRAVRVPKSLCLSAKDAGKDLPKDVPKDFDKDFPKHFNKDVPKEFPRP